MVKIGQVKVEKFEQGKKYLTCVKYMELQSILYDTLYILLVTRCSRDKIKRPFNRDHS